MRESVFGNESGARYRSTRRAVLSAAASAPLVVVAASTATWLGSAGAVGGTRADVSGAAERWLRAHQPDGLRQPAPSLALAEVLRGPVVPTE